MMTEETFSLSHEKIQHFNKNKIPNSDEIDLRMIQFLDLNKWQLKTIYESNIVDIPGHPGSAVELVKYYQVVKKPGDPFFRKDERDNEIGCTLWFGWPGYDHECEVNLYISGPDLLSGKNRIRAEILKAGGAKMKLYFDGILLTNFTKESFKKNWWDKTMKIEVDKVWIDDLRTILNYKN